MIYYIDIWYYFSFLYDFKEGIVFGQLFWFLNCGNHSKIRQMSMIEVNYINLTHHQGT